MQPSIILLEDGPDSKEETVDSTIGKRQRTISSSLLTAIIFGALYSYSTIWGMLCCGRLTIHGRLCFDDNVVLLILWLEVGQHEINIRNQFGVLSFLPTHEGLDAGNNGCLPTIADEMQELPQQSG
jgi:hypothetical protein